MATAAAIPPVVQNATAFEQSWEVAYDRCKSRLDRRDAALVVHVKSYDHFQTAITMLQRENKSKPISRAVTKLEPFLLNLRSFAGIVDTCVQANPNPAALIWGMIKLVLELALRFTNSVEKVTQGMLDVGTMLPRFQTYQKLFPNSTGLNNALIDVYDSIIHFCLESVEFFRTRPLLSLFRSTWIGYDQIITDATGRMEKKGRIVDVESHAANMTVEASRHDEIIRLISSHPISPEIVLPCYKIPYEKNLGFFGRQSLLRVCEETLSGNNTSGHQRRFALHGMGGVGKTSIALQFAYSQKATFNVIVWLNSDDSTTLSRAYVEIAEALGLHQNQADAETDAAAVKHWLAETHEKWLLIFDNVTSLATAKSYLPVGGSGSILITSRDPESQHSLAGRGVKVQPFDQTEGSDFLIQQLPGYDSTHQAAVQEAEALNSYFGGLALGLKQMGSFIRESGCSIPRLLELLKDKDQYPDLVSTSSEAARIDYNYTLETAWKVSMSLLDHQALNILGLLSFLDPAGIQENLLDDLFKLAKRFPAMFPAPTPAKMLAGISSLCRFGLIDQYLDKRLITIHRVVQATTLHSITSETRQSLFNVAVLLLRSNHPQSQATSDTLFHSWSKCATYSSHVLRLQLLQTQWQITVAYKRDLFELNFNCSWYLLEIGSMAEAFSLAKHTEQICDPLTRDGQLQLSYLYNTYACVHLQHKENELAMQYFTQSYNIRTKYLGDEDVNTMAVRGNLMLVLLNQDKFDEVINTQLPYRDKIPTTLTNLPNRVKAPIYDQLSMAYLGLNNLEEAWNHIEMSVEMSKGELEMFSQGSAYDYFVQGNIRIAQGLLEDALRLHTIGLNIRKQVLGDHIQTGASCYRVGDLMARLHNYEESCALLEDCIRIYDGLKLIGDLSQGGKARSLWRLASVLRAMGKHEEAEAYESSARQIRHDILGDAAQEILTDADFDRLLPQMDR